MLRFGVLGPLEVRDGERLIELPPGKQRSLVAALLPAGRTVSADTLIEDLWGKRPPTSARNMLQVYVSKLRKALGATAIETVPTGYRLRSDAVAVDTERFESLFDHGREALAAGDAAGAAEKLSDALALWRGTAYADCRYEAFAQAEAGRLEELRLACLEARIDADLALGRHATLIAELEALILEQPLREGLRAQLIVALYQSGRQAEALAQYQAARRMLADELGLEPSPELRDLERMILSQDPDLAVSSPSVRLPSNLPAQPTTFIGRHAELAEAAELFRRPEVRLLTLTGPGGSGKTRLALQLAGALVEEFSDGAFFVDLASISDAPLVVAKIAETLGVQPQAGVAIEEVVADHLRERKMLVLLDNFEQVLSAGPSVSALLAGAAGLNVLVTSRAPLRIRGETELVVPPLPDHDAVELFVDRARAVKSDFVLTNENAPTLGEICARLDGLPLAIELAAARVRALAPTTLLERLEPRLALLSEGARDAPDRQQTLRATLDWSYALLDEEERRLFAQLSVFVGGWDFEGVEAVADPEIAVVDTVASLVENSLVREAEDSEGAARYSMLETIREYAGELLAGSAEGDVVHRRHAEYLLTLARRIEAYRGRGDFSVPGDPERRIVEELPNLRAALEWALDCGDATFALELASTAGWAWTLGGLPQEGTAWMSLALDAAEDPEPVAAADAAQWLALFANQQGELQTFERLAEHARELAEATGDSVRMSRVHVLSGIGALQTGRVDQARLIFEQTRAQAEQSGDQFLLARMRVAESLVETTAGNYEAAQTNLEEGLALFRKLGAPRRYWLYQLLNVGWIALHRHDLIRAKAALEEFLQTGSETNPVDIAIAHAHLGLVALNEDDRNVADRHFRQALAYAQPSRAKAIATEVLIGMGAVAAMDGDAERALRLWGAAVGMRAEMQSPLTAPEQVIVERYLEPICKSTGPEETTMSLDDAVAYALGDRSYV